MAPVKANGISAVTSRDVARAANVSQALVSRAFSGKGRIAPETRERILAVAAEIGWQPNALAAGMVTGDAPLVAVITTRLHFDWRARVLSRLLKAFEEWHLKPILFYAENDDQVDRLLGETISWRTRGVIVTAGVIGRERADAILSRGQFLAALNRPANHSGAFSVATDNPLGGAMAASLLVADGRRRFVVLGGPQGGWANGLRTQGFLDAMLERGIAPSVWSNPVMSIEAGKACAERFLAMPPAERPDAVFSTNDAMALGFIDGLRPSGISIPRDVAVVGFDNLPASSWTPYQLTTFEQPLDDMVSRVLDHVETHQQSRNTASTGSDGSSWCAGTDGVLYCPPRLIVRSTSGVTE
ncbi:LacI family DNA-binding transcriptional regulator [Kaistia adipata]|uniref:LacI family DNA-binding transcriptional regulator n=1 Tax=Kaistia adipata TaxID=166954 RepID=UPI00041184C1|nr:LacI family DNA-binding transcriptional regulator [Kaistia adipata]